MPQAHPPTSSRNLQASLSVLLILSIISAFYYITFLLDFNNVQNISVFAVLMLIEAYVILQTIGTWWTILYSDYNPRSPIYYDLQKDLRRNPTEDHKVAIFITVYGEDIDIVRTTAIAARDMKVAHSTYILDDGHSDDIKSLANELRIGYIRRSDRKGKKAGNVNNALKLVDADFIAVFDADHVPQSNYLTETLPFLLAEGDVAFVQTPQFMTNRDTLVSAGAGDSQLVFYELVGSGKNKFNAMFWVGTNAIFRKSALMGIGGVFEHASEDIMTAYELHERGWRSIYIPQVLAKGIAPDRIDAYLKQQLRWAAGGFTLFFHRNPILSKMNLDQKLQYLLTTTHYFSGVVNFLMMLMPLIFLYFGVKPINTTTYNWMIHYVPFFFLQFIVVLLFMGKLSWQAYVLSINSFTAHIKALLLAVFGREVKWNTSTGAVNGSINLLDFVWPHILLLIISILAIPAGLLSVERDLGTTMFSIFWVLLNSLSIGTFLYQLYSQEFKVQKNLSLFTPNEAKKSFLLPKMFNGFFGFNSVNGMSRFLTGFNKDVTNTKTPNSSPVDS